VAAFSGQNWPRSTLSIYSGGIFSGTAPDWTESEVKTAAKQMPEFLAMNSKGKAPLLRFPKVEYGRIQRFAQAMPEWRQEMGL